MCDLAVLVLAVAVSAPPPVRLDDAAALEALLRRADLGGFAPDSFRARVRLAAGDRPPLDVEVWRKGDARTLVRLLGPKEQGRYLLRLDDALWLLAPGARKPVRLDARYRLRGSATLDDVLGLSYARDYRVERAEEEGDGLVALELAARLPGAVYPTVRYVVRPSTSRPVRAEYRLPSGKTATIVELDGWREGRHPYAQRLLVRDALHGGAVTTVEILEVEERAVPDGLFDLADPTERARLEGAPAARERGR
jgi:hypothetical protein